MASILFFEINAFCLILLLWVLYVMLADADKQLMNILYLKVLFLTMFMIVCDVLCFALNGRQGTVIFYLFNVVAAFRYLISGYLCMYWFLFIGSMIRMMRGERNADYSFFEKSLISFPAFVLAVTACLSPCMKILFYIEPVTNVYDYGDYIFIQRFITYGYFTLSCLKVLIYLLKKDKGYKKVRNMTFYACFILPTIGGIVSFYFPGAPFIWVGLSVVLVFVFFDMQVANISLDGLTKVNNRRLFNTYLSSCINEIRSTKNLYLIMLDINKFKQINDEYGHQEGDNALVIVAEALKKTCFNKDCFVSRYGGDEFAVLCWAGDDAEVYAIEKEILLNLRHLLIAKKLPYKLSLSIGFEERGKDCFGNSDELLRKADRALYEAKSLSEKMND